MKNLGSHNIFLLKVLTKLLIFLTIFYFFSACTTLKNDLFVDSSREQMESGLFELEEKIVRLEALGGAEARKRLDQMITARQMIGDMEKESAADADYSSRLAAWSGRLSILEGKYTEAQRLYRQSQASRGNIPSIILGIRLEGDPAKRLETIDKELSHVSASSTGYGELHIERARALAELRRFGESVGSFDTAFAALNDVYQDSYREMRYRAWELRNADGAAIDILEKGGVSWKDCIALAKNETKLLRFLTAGRDMSETELFNQLINRGFIPATQDITLSDWPETKPQLQDIVLRGGAAWFIWHLYAETRADRGLLFKYSTRFATGNRPRSPIGDVPPLSPFFDSILGCVETEALSLPDGRAFMSKEPIRGAALLAALKKIDN